MRVIPPVTIDATKLTYSSVAEPAPGEVAYNGGTEYFVGDVVVDLTLHKKYTSLQGTQKVGITLTIASPCVVTWNDHELVTGERVKFATSGALPPEVVVGTTYYAVVTSPDTFTLSTAVTGGTAINTTGSQSGTHTIKASVNLGRALPVSPATQTDWWKESGVTNKYACFDLVRNTQTEGTSPMVQTITPGQRVDSIAVLGIDAAFVQVQVTSAGVEVYNVIKSLIRRRIRNAYDYAFLPFDYARSFVAFNIPPYTNAVITVTLTRSDGVMIKCGSIVVGMSTYIGITQRNAESDSLNFSKIERNELGETLLVPRRTIPKTKQSVIVSKDNFAKMLDLRTKLNAVPAVWTALDDGNDDFFEPMLLLGIYKQFLLNLRSNDALATLDLEEI